MHKHAKWAPSDLTPWALTLGIYVIYYLLDVLRGQLSKFFQVVSTNHITPPETARPCLTLYSPAYSSSENMHYPVLARIQLI